MKTSSSIGLIILVLTLFLFVGSILSYSYFEDKASELVSTFGVLMIFLLSIIFEFIPQYLSPHIFLFSILIVDINPFIVLLTVLIGSTLGSSLGYAVGRVYHNHFVSLFFEEKKIKSLKKSMNKYGKWYVFVAALSPLPYIPMIFGMLHLTKRNFLIYGVISRIVGLIVLFLFVQFY